MVSKVVSDSKNFQLEKINLKAEKYKEIINSINDFSDLLKAEVKSHEKVSSFFKENLQGVSANALKNYSLIMNDDIKENLRSFQIYSRTFLDKLSKEEP